MMSFKDYLEDCLNYPQYIEAEEIKDELINLVQFDGLNALIEVFAQVIVMLKKFIVKENKDDE